MDQQSFHLYSWYHFLYSTPRYIKRHWLLLSAFLATYFASLKFSPEIANAEQFDRLNESGVLSLLLLQALLIMLQLSLTLSIVRFLCIDDGVKFKLTIKSGCRFLVAYSLILLCITLSSYLLILPALFIWIGTLLVPVLTLVHGYTIAEAFYASFDAVRGQLWKIVLSSLPVLVILIAAILGPYYLFNYLGWTSARQLFEALLFPVSVMITTSYMMILYDQLSYDDRIAPQGLKLTPK